MVRQTIQNARGSLMFSRDASLLSCGSPLLRSGSAMLPASFLVQSGGSPPLPTALAIAAVGGSDQRPRSPQRGFYDLHEHFSMVSTAPQTTTHAVDVAQRSRRTSTGDHPVLDCVASDALSLALVRRARLATRRTWRGVALSPIG